MAKQAVADYPPAHKIVLGRLWKLPNRQKVIQTLLTMGYDYLIEGSKDIVDGQSYVFPVRCGWTTFLSDGQAGHILQLPDVLDICEVDAKEVYTPGD